eukprot:gene7118-16098_t
MVGGVAAYAMRRGRVSVPLAAASAGVAAACACAADAVTLGRYDLWAAAAVCCAAVVSAGAAAAVHRPVLCGALFLIAARAGHDFWDFGLGAFGTGAALTAFDFAAADALLAAPPAGSAEGGGGGAAGAGSSNGRPTPSPGNALTEGPTGTVTLVFTDIQGSTVLWEANQEAMDLAMETHNELMRAGILAHRGYEVKTIGDAFMVAFEEAKSAVGFCLNAQVDLVETPWQPELTSLAGCGRHELPGGQVVWHGLRVRMGIHIGEVRRDTNPVTGRSDYFGPTVNKASRVADAACGGLVVCTEDVLVAVGTTGLEELSAPVVIPLGQRVFKGVAGKCTIAGLLPRALEARETEMAGHVEQGEALAPRAATPVASDAAPAEVDGKRGSDAASVHSP